MDYSVVYQTLIKPSFAPPAWLFGPVWTILYVLIFIAGIILIHKLTKDELPIGAFVLFAINIIANLLFMPFQTMTPTLMPATIILFIILLTLLGLFFIVPKYSRTVLWLLLPYFVWVIFASILQISIIILN